MREPLALLGNYGHGNLGDEAILTGFVDATSRVRPDLLPVLVLSDDPADTAARIEKDKVRAERFRRALGGKVGNVFGIAGDVVRSLRRARNIVLAGGGLINDSNPTSLLLYTAVVLLAPLTRTKVHGFAISIGPLDTAMGRILARILVRRLVAVSVRDAESQRMARSLGRSDAELVPDAALAMERRLAPRTAVGSGERVWTVAISVVPLGRPGSWYESNQVEYQGYLRMMVDLSTKLIRERGARVLLLPINILHDSKAAAEIRDAMTEEVRPSAEVVEVAGVTDVLKALSEADVLLACRLHSAVMATFERRPFATLAYQNKVAGYTTDLGLQRLTADIRQVDSQACEALLYSCWSDRTAVQDSVAAYAAEAAERFDVQWSCFLHQFVPAGGQ